METLRDQSPPFPSDAVAVESGDHIRLPLLCGARHAVPTLPRVPTDYCQLRTPNNVFLSLLFFVSFWIFGVFLDQKDWVS